MKNKVIFGLLIITVIAIIILMLSPEKMEDFKAEIVQSLPLRNQLFTLLTSTNKKTISKKLWKDMSGSGNSFTWTSVPPLKNKSFVVTNQKATLKTNDNLNSDEFSILIKCKTLNNNSKMSTNSILHIPGNQGTGLSFNLPHEYGKIHLKIADEKIDLTEKKVPTAKLQWYGIVKHKNKLSVYVDGVHLHTEKLKKKVHFENKMIINRSMKSNFELETIAMYNNSMSQDNMNQITQNLDQHHQENKDDQNNQDNNSQAEDYSSKKDCHKPGKCPKAYKRDGNFYVYIYKNSIYNIGRWGEINYGRDRKNARQTYSMNFPDCRIPKILTGEENPNKQACPFIVSEGNPCQSRHCSDVDWSGNPMKEHINKKCKRSISNYCELNNEYDPACYCWKSNFQDDRYCARFRRHFDDHKCNPSSIDIKDHPDYNQYIKKDEIPCWNCNLNQTNS